MAKLKYRYRDESEMKDSGVEWLGMIPKEWGVERIKYLYSLRNERNQKEMSDVQILSLYTALGVKKQGDIEYKTGNKVRTVLDYKIVYPDDIVVNIILAWMGSIGISNYKGVVSPAYDIYSPLRGTFSKYYNYIFRTKQFAGECFRYGRGIMLMRWRTYSDEFMSIPVTYPSIQEQQKIADFLDLKTARFDSIIEKKEKLIEKLLEAKKSLISEVVTGKKKVKLRLREPQASEKWEVRDREESEMKDSGVEWLGRIPKGWGVKRLKHFAELVPKKSEVIESKELECTFLPMEKLKTNSIILDTNKKIDDVYSGYTYFQEDDILMAKVTPCFENRNICIAKNLTNKIGFGSSEIYPIRINKNNSNKFYFYHFMEETFINIGASEMTGAGGLKRVPSNFLNNMYFVSPTLDTQEIISDYLDDKTSKIDTSIEKIKIQINKLKEAKKSLISEVVTGKIEVL